MTFTQEELKNLRRLGAALRTVEHTCLIMELDEEAFKNELKDKSSEAYKNYIGGREETMTLVMENVIVMAKRGSSTAQEQVFKYYQTIKISEA